MVSNRFGRGGAVVFLFVEIVDIVKIRWLGQFVLAAFYFRTFPQPVVEENNMNETWNGTDEAI